MRGAAAFAGVALVGRVPFAAARAAATAPDLRSIFRSTVICGGRTLYVAGNGSDSNVGTQGAPFRQIQHAVDRARPGDLILVGTGVYAPVSVRGFAGSPSGWLGIMSLNDAARPQCFAAEGNAVAINGSSFVGVYGLEVAGRQAAQNPDGSGINVYGNSHHVVIWKNEVHTFPGGGINCFDVDDQWGFGSHDLVDISFNRIYDTSRYSPWATSGISIFASRDLTGGATWDGRYGYRIVGNYIYDVENLVPFSNGGYAFVTDGNGISIDSLVSKYGYRKPVLIEGNLLVGCGGRAVHVFDSVNVDGFGNTAIGNLRTQSPAISGGAEFDGTTDASVHYHGNVILPRHTSNWRDRSSTYTHNVVLGGTQAVAGSNVDRRALGYGYLGGGLTDQGLLTSQALSAFTPLRVDRVPRAAGSLGWQTLGIGHRPHGPWAAADGLRADGQQF